MYMDTERGGRIVSEKVVTTMTHIVHSSYAVHVAVMRRDAVVARMISAACSLFLRGVGYVRRSLLNAIILLLSLEFVETPCPHAHPVTEHYNHVMQKYTEFNLADRSQIRQSAKLNPRQIFRPYQSLVGKEYVILH